MTRYLSLLGVVVGLLFAAYVAFDFERETNDTVTLSAFLDPAQDRREPVNTTYNIRVNIRGRDGTQPQLVTRFDILIAATQLQRNSSKFPSPCTKDDIDGKKTVPSKCMEGLIASGTATASAGAPGAEPLETKEVTVRLFNADYGKSPLLVVNSTGEHAVHNRVIVGEAKEIAGKFRWVTVFRIPDYLQKVPGTLIPSVITRTSMRLGTVHKGTGFVQLMHCPPSERIPSKVVYYFNDGSVKTATTTLSCKRERGRGST